jgi:hypothetical protein
MKLAELADKAMYAYRPSTSDNRAQPAQVVEARLWRRDEKWDIWDGEPKRTRQTVVTRAVKGDRAGRSDGWSATSWAIGVPVLVLDARDYMWTTAQVKIAELPYLIFAKAWHQMNPDHLVEEGHDGRFTKEFPAKTDVEVRMSDGSTQSFVVRLEFVRPQTLIQEWNSYMADKKTAIERSAAFEAERAEKQRRENLRASSIRNKVDALLGAPDSYDENVERPDLHRKSVSTGNTYEVSEETLRRLIALAEKGSSQ